MEDITDYLINREDSIEYKNVTGTNVGNIKEDIKVLEIFLKEMNYVFQQTKINNTKERNALKNLLQDYARQKQINEEHQKINGELREKVKELEKYEQMYLDELDKRVDIILLYNKLLKENKELKAKLEFKQWGDLDNIRFEEYMNEFVPKQKIKDRIEELENENYQIALDSEVVFDTEIMKNNLKIQVLEELLPQEETNE